MRRDEGGLGLLFIRGVRRRKRVLADGCGSGYHLGLLCLESPTSRFY